MEVGQRFDFPFPTLKHLSLVSIGQLFANKTGRSAGFPDRPRQGGIALSHERRAQYSKFDGIVETLPVPENCKRLLLTTSAGMYGQLSEWYARCCDPFWKINEDMEVIFDMNGIVDESQTWQKCFERATRKKEVDKDYLRELLEVACRRTLVPLISMVLREIVILEGLASTTLLEDGQEIVDRKLVLAYSFGNTRLRQVPGSASAHEAFRWLSTCRWNNVSINVTDCGITMHLDLMQSMDLVKEHFHDIFDNQNLSSETLRWRHSNLCEYILLGLKRLDDADLLIFLARVKTSFLYESVLCSFLKWPFTQFLVPVVEFLKEHLESDIYSFLFLYIMHLIPGAQQSDVFGYVDLLLKFCSICPPDVKQWIRSGVPNNE